MSYAFGSSWTLVLAELEVVAAGPFKFRVAPAGIAREVSLGSEDQAMSIIGLEDFT